ncbi:MAG: restriction endonuclease subunit S [Muribaculum sp.]|nr:restriction endonuclease subunit S [Muribaculum sp.]
MRASKVKISNVIDTARRLDPSYHLSEAVTVRSLLENSPYHLLKLKDVSERIFNGGRYKRVYVSDPDHGYKFLSSSDILAADLESVKMVSKRYMGGVKELALEKGWTLITRSGTIGNTAFANAKHAQKLASEDVIRLVPNNILRAGLIYAYLSSKFGYTLLTQGTFGAVIQHIECPFVEELPIPKFPESFQKEVDDLIQDSARLREEAADELVLAEKILKEKAGLRDLTPNDYDYFGQHNATRRPSCFIRKASSIKPKSINAFNYSNRIATIYGIIPNSEPLKNVLQNGSTFSTGSFPRVEVKDGCGVMLINQSDAFDTIIKGKWISKRNVNLTGLVEYGEVIVAGVGTLGENETFCRTLFGNEDMVGQLISGEFIRMKTNGKVPSGYLYAWLNSDYGFRLIRNTQAGTKLCRPIPDLFLEIPIPILSKTDMDEIDKLVKTAHTKRHEANVKELKAISLVEEEIEKWK